MRRHSARFAVEGLLIATLALSACGGSAPSTNVLGTDFQAKAVAACEHALVLMQAEGAFPVPGFNPTNPDVTKLPAIANYLVLTDATFTTWATEIDALGQPPTGAAAWADVVAAIHKHRELNADQIGAARAGDAARFTKDYQDGLTAQAAMLKAANAAGVPECSKVDR